MVSDKEIMKYGCGKCQVSVPCEDKIPNKIFNFRAMYFILCILKISFV